MMPIWIFVKLKPNHKLDEFVINYLGGQDSGHLWFLVMLFTLFILYFMLEKIFENLKNLVNVLSKYNFEIYLLHESLIFLVLFKLAKTSINPTLLVLL